MRTALFFAIAISAALPAAAQQAGMPASGCMVLPTSRTNPVIGNKCGYPIYVELYDVSRRVVVEGEVRPKESLAAPADAFFGAVCPAGHRSSVAVMVENRHIFAQDLYRCIRR
jgi:hypothetical protein